MPDAPSAVSVHTGGCLCGAVRFSAPDVPETFSVCHCSMCRTWAGGPLLAVHLTGPVTFTGTENITTYRSSAWAERGFCKICGSSLFYRFIEDDSYVITLGTFDDQAAFTMKAQIFIDEKPPGYTFANDVPVMTGAEVFAKYAGN